MKYLFTGFQDHTNSSKNIAENLEKLNSNSEVLIFTNSKETCVKQLYAALNRKPYEYIIMFGQKPVIKDRIYIERQAKVRGDILVNHFIPSSFAQYLAEHDYAVKESVNAGTSFCNWIYYHALKYMEEHSLMTRVLFIHIPVLENISDYEKLMSDFQHALSYMDTY